MKIITVVGARPQFIKAAIISKELKKKKDIVEIMIHTGQHYDKNMSEVFFKELKIPEPKYNLGVGSKSHGAQTGKMLEKIEVILLKEKPDGVLIYGDTNSTVAGALAASKLLIPVFHVEAGLRSYDADMPEEQNRVVSDHLSKVLFCPTKTAIKNLKKEGIITNVINSGDIMYEMILHNIKKAEKKYANFAWKKEIKNLNLSIKHDKYYLATIHRPVNTDNEQNLITIFNALNKLKLPVVMPLHPRTLNIIKNMNLSTENIHIIDPVCYSLMLFLTSNAYMVITDSGGLQKEAYLLDTPCVTLRDETEWIETLVNDWNVLCPIEEDNIIKNANREVKELKRKPKKVFGDGTTSKIIIKEMISFNNLRKGKNHEKNK